MQSSQLVDSCSGSQLQSIARLDGNDYEMPQSPPPSLIVRDDLSDDDMSALRDSVSQMKLHGASTGAGASQPSLMATPDLNAEMLAEPRQKTTTAAGSSLDKFYEMFEHEL